MTDLLLNRKQRMAKIGSHRLVVRMPGSQPGDRGSSPRESICPHCGECFDYDNVVTARLPVSPGDFTVCPTCREIIRFDGQLQLKKMYCQDWLDLCQDKELFVVMFRWRMRIFADQLKEQKLGHSVDGIPGSR